MNIDALKELAKKVEAGDDVNALIHLVENFKDFDDRWEYAGRVINSGSLDAAKALHDAVLPGWAVEFVCRPFGVGPHRTHIMLTDDYTGWGNGLRVNASSDNSARAWLLAILRALIAQAEAE